MDKKNKTTTIRVFESNRIFGNYHSNEYKIFENKSLQKTNDTKQINRVQDICIKVWKY